VEDVAQISKILSALGVLVPNGDGVVLQDFTDTEEAGKRSLTEAVPIKLVSLHGPKLPSEESSDF